MHSSEKKDPKLDRMLCFFIMKNIDYLIINVKSEIKRDMADDLKSTLFKMNKFRSFKKLPEIAFVFNQTTNTDEDSKEKLKKQCKLNEGIKEALKYRKNFGNQLNPSTIMDTETAILFPEKSKNIFFLQNAFKKEDIEKDSDIGLEKTLTLKKFDKSFNNKCSEISKMIFDKIKKKEVCKASKSCFMYLKDCILEWNFIQNYSHLYDTEDVDQLKNKYAVETEIRKLYQHEYKEKIKKILFEKRKQIEQELDSINEKLETTEIKIDDILKNLRLEIEILENKMKDIVKSSINARNISKDTKLKILEALIINIHFEIFEIEIFANNKLNNLKLGQEIFENKINVYEHIKRFQKDTNFMALPKNEKIKEIEKKVNNLFEMHFKNNSELISKNAEKQYLFLNQTLRKMEDFSPNLDKKIVQNITISNEEKDLKTFLKINALSFYNLDSLFKLLKKNNLKNFNESNFLNFKDHQIKVNVLKIEDVEKSFKKKFFRKELFRNFKKIKNKVNNENEIEKWFYETIQILEDLEHFGVCFNKIKNYKKLKKYFLKSSNSIDEKEKLKKILDNPMYNNNLKINKMLKFNIGRFFEIKKINLNFDKFIQKNKKIKSGYFKISEECPFIIKENSNLYKYNNDFNIVFNNQNNKLRSSVLESSKKILLRFFNYKKIILEIEKIVISNLKGTNYNLKDCQNLYQIIFNTDLSKSIIFKIVQQDMVLLFQKINKSLKILGYQINNCLEGYLKHVAILFIWKFLDKKQNQTYKEANNNLQNIKMEKINKLKTLILEGEKQNAKYLIKEEILNVFKSFLKKEKKEKLQSIIKVIKNKKTSTQFKSYKISQKLDNKYFSNKVNFESLLTYLKDPDSLINEEIKSLLNEHIFKIIENYNKDLKKKIVGELNDFKKYFTNLKENLKKYGQNNNKNYFEIYNSNSRTSIHFSTIQNDNQLKDLISKYSFKTILFLILEKSSIKKSNLQEEYVIDFLYDFDEWRKIKKKLNKSKLWKDFVNNLKKYENTTSEFFINSFDNFFQFAIDQIDQIKKNNKDFAISKDHLEIRKVIDEYRFKAYGCPQRCPFCFKKCENSSSNKHTHHINRTGHRPRIFGNTIHEFGDLKLPCLMTCDSINPEASIKYNDKFFKYDQIIAKISNWDLKFVSETQNYDELWEYFGDKICKYNNLNVLQIKPSEFTKQFYSGKIGDKIHLYIIFEIFDNNHINDYINQFWKYIKKLNQKSINYFLSIFCLESSKNLRNIFLCKSINKFTDKKKLRKYTKKEIEKNEEFVKKTIKNLLIPKNYIFIYSQKPSILNSGFQDLVYDILSNPYAKNYLKFVTKSNLKGINKKNISHLKNNFKKLKVIGDAEIDKLKKHLFKSFENDDEEDKNKV